MLNERTLRVAILCSTRAPGLGALLSDPARGFEYEIACVITNNRDLREREALVGAGIACIARPAPPRDLHEREQYDAETAAYLATFDVDLVVLCCYLRILTAPMLAAFPQRIVNLHDSDLAITGDGGNPRYVGLRSTLDAIVAGERETRATAHWVSEKVDGGPILLRSEAFPVPALGREELKPYARLHREWVIRTTWGPLMKEAIRRIAWVEAAVA
jgi:phosphoribosylglycinamide formyltransferase-1